MSMAEMSEQVEIPNRVLFKAAEVCDLAKVQPYVLRSWEAEFKDLGVAKGTTGTRVYRREDVERVLRIRHLLLVEGLTLAGVRRRLEEEAGPLDEEPFVLVETAPVSAPRRGASDHAKQQLEDVKRGLRGLLDLLSQDAAHGTDAASTGVEAAREFALAPPDGSREPGRAAARRTVDGENTKSVSPRRKRSA